MIRPRNSQKPERLKPILDNGRILGHGAQLARKRLQAHAAAHPVRPPALMSRPALRWADRVEEKKARRHHIRWTYAQALASDRTAFPRPKVDIFTSGPPKNLRYIVGRP